MEAPASTDSPSHLIVGVALVVLTLLAYSNSFHTGFALDNKGLILADPRVHSATAANLTLILEHSYWWPYGEAGLYRPLTSLSYLFNYAVLGNGERSTGYHAVNAVLQMANVLLAYALAWRLTREKRIALGIAAVWAVHPLATEAVTNIVGRADLLAALTVLGGLWIYVKSAEVHGVLRLAWLAGLMSVAAVGVFSKESAVVLLAVIVLYEATWWQRDRSVSRLIWGMAAIAPPLLVYGYQRSAVLSAALTAEFPFTDNPITGAGFWIGRLTAIRVMARYLALIAWPAWLSCDYSYAQIPLARGTLGDWAAVAVIGAAGASIVLLFRRHRGAFFWGAFAFVTFLPASNLLFPTGTIMAERLVYLPSLGVIGIAVIGTFALAARIRVRATAPIAICLIASGFAVRTWTRNLDWQDDVTLWSRATETSPMSSKAHRALAEALYDADPRHANLDRVIAEAERSMAIQGDLPDTLKSPQSYRQVAAYYLDQADLLRREATDGRAASTPKATRAYQRALDVARQCLSIIEIGSAKIAGASTAPSADAYRLLAGAYLGLQDPANALDAAARARTLEPSHPLGYRQTAAALLDEDRPDEAAVSLVVGFMVTGDAGLRQEVLDLYRAGLDDKGCAIRATPNGPVFDPSCDIVRRHLCAAAADTMRVYLQMGRGDRAETLERSAAHDFGCDPTPLERVLSGSR